MQIAALTALLAKCIVNIKSKSIYGLEVPEKPALQTHLPFIFEVKLAISITETSPYTCYLNH